MSVPAEIHAHRTSHLVLDSGAARTQVHGSATVGFLLTDSRFATLHANESAVRILSYPLEPQFVDNFASAAQGQLRNIFNAERYSPQLEAATFLSGRRCYSCRLFPLEASGRPAIVALLLERQAHDPAAGLSEVGRRFHLSPRERETVRHISHGLTTKEIAQQMSVSPNTIKQFVRLIMSKMNVTTRSGIIGKLIGC